MAKFNDDHIPLRFSKDGIHIQVMDASMVSVLDINLALDFFETYTCPVDCLAIFNSKTILKLFKSKDDEKIQMEMINPSDDSIDLDVGNKTYTVRLMDTEIQLLALDETNEQDIIISANKKYFETMVQDVKNIGATDITLEITKDSTIIIAEVDDLKLCIRPEKSELTTHSCNKNSTIMYNFKYIEIIEQLLELLSNKFLIYLDSDRPMLCEMTISNSKLIKQSKSSIRYYISPKY